MRKSQIKSKRIRIRKRKRKRKRADAQNSADAYTGFVAADAGLNNDGWHLFLYSFWYQEKGSIDLLLAYLKFDIPELDFTHIDYPWSYSYLKILLGFEPMFFI